MKHTLLRMIITASVASVLVFSLSSAALAEGSDQESPSQDQQTQQSQPSEIQPGNSPGTQNLPGGFGMHGREHGFGQGRNGGRNAGQGMNGQKPGGMRRSGTRAEDILSSISGLEDGAAKENLTHLYETWKTALDAVQKETSTAINDLEEAESALNEALKAAGLNGTSPSGSFGYSPTGKAGRARFSEIRSAIDQLEDAETKEQLTTLLDALTSLHAKAKHQTRDALSQEISSAEDALNQALSDAGIDLKVGQPETVSKEAPSAPAEPVVPSEAEVPASGDSLEESSENNVSDLLDIIRNWLKDTSD